MTRILRYVCLCLVLTGNLFESNSGLAQGRPTEDSGQVKNVLLIVSDDLKASVLGCYGNPRCQTPNIDRLAKQSMVFERAYCQGTVCRPSRQSFMFSRYLDGGTINLGQHFRESGWYSARVGKIYHMKVPGDIIAGTDGLDVPSSWTEKFNSPGLEAHTPGDYACLNLNIFTDALENRQSTAMPHRMFVTVQYDGDGSDQPDHKSATQAIELLNAHQREPFFLAVGLVRPHYPMVAPREYFTAYPWQDLPLPRSVAEDELDIPPKGLAATRSDSNPIGNYPDNQRRMWAGYYASVSFMDAQVGRILDELERLGLREQTAIVFISDHGYHLGEHGFWQKANLHEEVIRVPMLISIPGNSPGRCDSIVELVDVYPTLCDWAGLPVPKDVQGKSLLPAFEDAEVVIKEGALSFRNGFSFRTPDWHLMRYDDGTYELYDTQSDPNEFSNLANKLEFAKKRDDLDRAMQSRLAKLGIAN